jgi:hypothetical protein
MAKVQNPLIGDARGKIGNTVFSKWKGINTLRTKPIEVNNPESVAQLTQRQKFSLILAVSIDILALIRVGFQNFANAMSEFNAFMSWNMKNAITGSYPSQAVDWENLKISRGNLPGLVDADLTPTAPANIAIAWTDNSGESGASADDTLSLAFYNITTGTATTDETSETRSNEGYTASVPESWAGDTVKAYGFFKDTTGLVVSDSVLIKSFTAPAVP